ncbi:MAG: DNA-formamidopyrimidine glycosylase [Desulfuromonadales bacterium]
MPELPEVENVLRSLRDGPPALTGQVIHRALIIWSGVLSGSNEDIFQAMVQNSTFSAISRHGKYLIFTLSSINQCRKEFFLIVHLRMTGRLYLVPRENAVVRHTRVSLLLGDDLALRFDDPRKFGRIWLVNHPDEVTCGLGPDALTVDSDYVESALAERRRQIKPLLLDQSFIAGIGNIYADEILFRAGIHPLASTEALSDNDKERLYDSMIGVLSEAVDARGANVDGVFKEGAFVVDVYGRTGESCRVCDTAITKIRVGQRGTHYCPTCQPLRSRP